MRKKRKLTAFTLVEMLIVLLVVSVLLMLIVPNIVKQQSSIQKKGCEAYMNVVQGQIQIYKIDNSTAGNPTIETLVDDQYIKSSTCQDGTALKVDDSGTVVKI